LKSSARKRIAKQARQNKRSLEQELIVILQEWDEAKRMSDGFTRKVGKPMMDALDSALAELATDGIDNVTVKVRVSDSTSKKRPSATKR
jgi:hypothetical protein